MMRLRHTIVAIIVMVTAMPGCKSDGPKQDDMNSARDAAAQAGAQIGRYGPGGMSGAGTGAGGGAMAGKPAPGSRVVYFAYDSDDVLPESVPVVDAQAAYLAANARRTVTLEGHADERGSSEYNIALGEQRARAVARLLGLQGVSEAQVDIVSFGEEKAADPGHDEAAWQRNRRVEFKYAGH